MKKIKKKFRDVKKLPDWIYFMFAILVKIMIKCLYRVRIEDPGGQINSDENFVVVIWHNRMIFMPAVFPKSARVRTQVIVSASRDGQYIADVVHQFSLKTIRGSTSREGAKAQRGALKALEENWHVVLTPDGPRGPKYRMSQGAIRMAANTGKRIAPVAVNATRYWALRSWDGFQIPKPFSTITLIIGELIAIPKGLSEKDELEKWRKITEEELIKISID